jgi:hypothetical protein
LAAKHDPSGKTFNVGEVITLENGLVKSKEAWKRSEEARAAREAGIAPPPNVNPERQSRILNSQGKPKKPSKKQQQRLEALNPKKVPPKPVIPGGIEVPEGEENFVALWELDDKGIEARITRQRSEKRAAARALRRKQQEQKKFNRALKVKKKQAAHAGVLFDPEQAKREILGEMTEEEDSESDAKSKDGSESENSSDDSDSSSDSDSDSDGGAEVKEAEAKSKKSKRSTEGPAEGQPDAKKSKSSSESTEKKKVKKYKQPPNVPKLNMNILSEEDIAKRVKKEQHRVKLDLKRKTKLEKNIAEGNPKTLAAVGLIKRNRKKDETPEEKAERRAKRAEKKARIEARKADPAEQERRAKLKEVYAAKKEAKKQERRAARREEKIARASKKRKRNSFS